MPVSHTGLQTRAQSHADPSLEASGSGTLWGNVPFLLWASYFPICSPLSEHAPQTGSNGVFDLRIKAKKGQEEGREQWTPSGVQPLVFWGGEPRDGRGAGCLRFSKLRLSVWIGL